jgi:hypothetical protein
VSSSPTLRGRSFKKCTLMRGTPPAIALVEGPLAAISVDALGEKQFAKNANCLALGSPLATGRDAPPLPGNKTATVSGLP